MPPQSWPHLESRLRIHPLLKCVALAAFVSGLLCGCGQSIKSYEELSEADRLNYLRGQADKAMLDAATNVFPGIRVVVEEHADTFEDSVDKWRGWVRLEYAGQAGGTERTNVPMVFIATFDGRLYGCTPSQMDPPVMGIGKTPQRM